EYGHSAGLVSYRQGLVGYYERAGIKLSFDDILVTTAGSEAILFALDAVTDPGDEVIVPEPFYTNYLGFAAMTGVRLVPVTARAEAGFRLPPAEEFERALGPRTRAILYSNPGNPTGVVYDREEMERMRRVALERDLYLIADEVYREFVYDGVEHHSVLNLPGIEDRAILVDSVSKRYSACGARIGCVASRNRDFMATMLRLGQARLCPPTVDQVAAEAALKVPDSYFTGMREEYRGRRDTVCEALAGVPGVVLHKPMGAFYVVAKLPIDDGERFAIFMLDEFSVEGKTVMVAPAEGFYATPGLGRDEVRIAYVLCCGDLGRAMEILKAGLLAYNRKG
ncbi:pyridoxal phosphate-dependent aminotransferase, partial [candidate division WOR-3 bacterium]|nr:pyridoxal phosphate-dependent aminotransferase [candidate division WOR-3 bacterium]